MKKIKFLMFTVALISAVCLGSNSMKVKAENIYKESFIEMNLKQNSIGEEMDKILKSEGYPSYYGGMYISDDSTHIVLQIVKENIPIDKNDENYKSYTKLVNISKDIKIKYVKFSYKELTDMNSNLVKYYSSKSADTSNLVAHYVDIYANNVAVELKDNTEKGIINFKTSVLESDSFKNVKTNLDLFEFKKGEPFKDQAIKSGERISVQNNGICSMGFRAKVNGKKGYITAGHCFNNIGNSSTGGTVKKRKYSGSVDAAFVETSWWTNNFNAPSNDLQYTNGSITKLDNTLCPYLMVNLAIAKSGQTTHYTSGKIKSLNYSVTMSNGTYFTDLISTTYSSQGGDSGGTVFLPSNTPNGGAPLVGIHKGSNPNIAVVVKADNIFNAFNYYRY